MIFFYEKEDILVNEIPQHLSSLPDKVSIGDKNSSSSTVLHQVMKVME